MVFFDEKGVNLGADLMVPLPCLTRQTNTWKESAFRRAGTSEQERAAACGEGI